MGQVTSKANDGPQGRKRHAAGKLKLYSSRGPVQILYVIREDNSLHDPIARKFSFKRITLRVARYGAGDRKPCLRVV